MSFAVGTNIVLVFYSQSYSPTTGLVSTYVYEGTEAAINGQANNLPKNQGLIISTDGSQAPMWRLTVQTPDIAITSVWNIDCNDIERTLYEHPTFLALGAAMLTFIKKYVDEGTFSTLDAALAFDIAQGLPDGASGPPMSSALTITNTARALWDLLRKGTDSYVRSQYVVKNTITLSTLTSFVVTWGGVDKIYTLAQILTESGGIDIPALLTLETIPIPTAPSSDAGQATYVSGWLKKGPKFEQFAQGKYQYVAEWWLDIWSTDIYSVR